MNCAQALAIAAASLVMAGHPWSVRMAEARAQAAEAAAHAEAVTRSFLGRADGAFNAAPDAQRIKRGWAVL